MSSLSFAKMNDSDSLKILYTQYDSIRNIQLIPENALNGNYDALVIGMEYDTIPTIHKNGFEISWPSINIDGAYYLIITAKQIYLCSGHENPNPNHLYWFTAIDTTQFELINKYLYNSNNKNLQFYNNEYALLQHIKYKSYKKEHLFKNDYADYLYFNFANLMKIINLPLKSKKIDIKIPDEKSFNKIHRLRMVYGLFELEDQLIIEEIK